MPPSTDAKAVRELLTEMRKSGARRVRFRTDKLMLEADFSGGDAEDEPAGLTLVGADGKPADLDEGMPELARDPIHTANYPAAD